LRTDLEALDATLREAAEGGEPLLGSHPVYQYLARGYGLDIRQLHWEPDEMPPPEEWKTLDALLRGRPARRMLWEARPAAEIEAELEKRGIEAVVYETAGNRPEPGDFLAVMRANAARLARISHRAKCRSADLGLAGGFGRGYTVSPGGGPVGEA
jgi:zinc transport system substrate-binding protein